jgi:hypothetical protein
MSKNKNTGVIDWNSLECIDPCVDQNERVTEASDLGLRPGHWPTTMTLLGPGGVHLTFHRDVSLRNHDNDIILVTYKSTSLGFKLKLTVWND